MTSGTIPKAATSDVINPKGTYFHAARVNDTFGQRLRRATPLGFLYNTEEGHYVAQIQEDMERLAAAPEEPNHVSSIRPLLGPESYGFTMQHVGRTHSDVVQQYLDAYLSFLGEPTTAVHPPGALYGDGGGMVLDQETKQEKAEEIISTINLDAFSNLMKGCTGDAKALLEKSAKAQEEADL